MLRPKQLIPISKGARAWLAVGCSKGNSADGNGAPPHSDDSRVEEQNKRHLTHVASNTISSSYRQRSSDGLGSRIPVDTPSRSYSRGGQPPPHVYVDRSNRSVVVEPSSSSCSGGAIVEDSHSSIPNIKAKRFYAAASAGGDSNEESSGKESRHGVGIAAVVKLPPPPSSSNKSSVASTFIVSPGSDSPLRKPRPNGTTAAATTTARNFSTLASKEGMATTSLCDPNKKGTNFDAVVIGSGGSLGSANTSAQSKASVVGGVNEVFSNLRICSEGSSSSSSSTSGGRISVGSDDTLNSFQDPREEASIVVYDDDDGWNGNDTEGRCSSKFASSSLSTMPRVNLKGNWQEKQAVKLPAKASSQCKGKKKGGGVAPFEQRGSGGGRRDRREVVDRVCDILQHCEWGPEAEHRLASLNSKLSVYHVNEVLKQVSEAGTAFHFFKWVGRQSGLKHDLHTYTTMIGILGKARRFDVLGALLEDMYEDGCQPGVVTFNRLIHCYGRGSRMDEALRVFRHMQEVGCHPDKVTYCTLIDLHAKAGFLNEAMNMYRQMQSAGLQPDTFTYSVMINCLGKAGELSAAHGLFCEMLNRGCIPNVVTYNIIIDLHAKAGKYQLALRLYNDMQDAGYFPDQVTYSIIMEVLGNLGHMEDAEFVFMEMQQEGWVPDMPVYGLLVDLWGKVGNIAKSGEWYKKMLDAGLTPNVPTCNSLLGAYLRASLHECGMRVLQDMLRWGLSPSVQTYTLLLSCFTDCNGRKEGDLLWEMMATTRHPAHSFLCYLLEACKEAQEEAWHWIRGFFASVRCEDQESKRGFTDAVVNFLHKSDYKRVAGIIWEVAAENKLYPHAVTLKAREYWSINLHVMSIGTAIVALCRTLAQFRDRMLNTGLVPEKIEIITGWGRRSRVTGSSLVKKAVEEILNVSCSPFHVDDGNAGCLISSGKPLMDWLQHPNIDNLHLL